MTGQTHLVSDDGFLSSVVGDRGLQAVVALVNGLVVGDPSDPEAELRRVLAFDSASKRQVGQRSVEPMTELATRTYAICSDLIAGDVDAAAMQVNELLSTHSAQPHLANQDGRWTLHHHPHDAQLVAMWTAIAGDALARLIGAGGHDRIGRCDAPSCRRLFVDASRNGSKKYCSTTCQNRVKAAAYRRRMRQPD